jgi:hypothetical protein
VFVVTTLCFATWFNSNVTQLLLNSERLYLAIDFLRFRRGHTARAMWGNVPRVSHELLFKSDLE